MQAEFGKQWQLQKDAVEKLNANQLRTLNDKIEEAKRKKNILIARQKRAEAQKAIQDTMRGLSDNSAFDTFERMNQKVEQIEAESEASAELGGELAGDTLQQKFKKLEGGSGGDLALAELKSKMGLGPAPERPALTLRAEHLIRTLRQQVRNSAVAVRIESLLPCSDAAKGRTEPMPQHQNQRRRLALMV